PPPPPYTPSLHDALPIFLAKLPLPMSPLRLTALAVLLFTSALRADDLRVFPAGQLPNDVRLQAPKDLDGYFPFDPPATADAWKKDRKSTRLNSSHDQISY